MPAAELTREFDAGETPAAILGRTVQALRRAGIRNLYFSNLVPGAASRTLRALLTSP